MDAEEAIRLRRSVRSYTDQPVDDADISAILRLALLAPTGGMAQAWSFIVVKDPELRAALLPEITPDPLRQLVGALPASVMAPVGDALVEALGLGDARQLQANLEQQGFSLSPLESKGLTVQAWTRLQSRPVKGNPDQLQAQLAGARSQERGWAWWGQGLAVLSQQHEGRQLPQPRLDQLQALGASSAPLQWAMDGGTAQGLLRRWQPWRLHGPRPSCNGWRAICRPLPGACRAVAAVSRMTWPWRWPSAWAARPASSMCPGLGRCA